MTLPTPRAIWDSLKPKWQDALVAFATNADRMYINRTYINALANRGLVTPDDYMFMRTGGITDLGRKVYEAGRGEDKHMTPQTPRDVWDSLTPDQQYDAYQRLWVALDKAERACDERDARLAAIADLAANTPRGYALATLERIEAIARGEA